MTDDYILTEQPINDEDEKCPNCELETCSDWCIKEQQL